MASYVYCFTRAGHPLTLDGLRGVGAAEAELRVVRHGGLAAFLIPSAAQDDFDAAAARLRAAMDGYADLRVSGALPPYSFVDAVHPRRRRPGERIEARPWDCLRSCCCCRWHRPASGCDRSTG